MVRVPLGRLESFLHEWRWDPAAEVVEDAISLFDPWGISPQELLLRLTFALQSAVGAELEGRDGFQGLSQADPGETRRLQKGISLRRTGSTLPLDLLALSTRKMPCITFQTTLMMTARAASVVSLTVCATACGTASLP